MRAVLIFNLCFCFQKNKPESSSNLRAPLMIGYLPVDNINLFKYIKNSNTIHPYFCASVRNS